MDVLSRLALMKEGVWELRMTSNVHAHQVQYIHSVAKVYAVFPFYDVKWLCSGGRE